MKKYNISRSGYLSKFHEMLRMPRKVTLQLHQILRLPRKMNHMIDPHQIWNVIYNARSNKNHPPTAPNTAPATQSHSHDSTPNSRSHTNTLPGHLPPMELRPPRAKKSHTQNSSPWNSVENSQMLQTPKVRDIQNAMEHKSHPPRTRYMFHHTSNGIAW